MMKGKLSFIGIGLHDEKDLTIRGMEEAKKSDKVFIELYTSKWHGSLKKLEKTIDKKIKLLKRKDLEENSKNILELAKTQNVSILVQGDSLVQTTHIALLQQARELKIKTKIIHNASIVSVVGETGLHPQKFGPYVTIPFLEKTKGKLPESVYDVIKMNKSRGLHTLCLLDIIAEEKKYMSPNDGMNLLLNIENERKENVFTDDTEVVIFARAGSEKPLIIYGKVNELIEKNFGNPPSVLIIPGILHFTEKDFIEKYKP